MDEFLKSQSTSWIRTPFQSLQTQKFKYLFQLSHSTSWTNPSSSLHMTSQYLLFLEWGSQGHYTVCIHLQSFLLFVCSCQVPRMSRWVLSACCHHYGETFSQKYAPQSPWKQRNIWSTTISLSAYVSFQVCMSHKFNCYELRVLVSSPLFYHICQSFEFWNMVQYYVHWLYFRFCTYTFKDFSLLSQHWNHYSIFRKVRNYRVSLTHSLLSHELKF